MGSPNGTSAAEEHGIRRSPHWPTVEKHFLASNPRCLACDDVQHAARVASNAAHSQTRGLQVHHALMPYHFCILLGRPELELDPRNLIVLCENEAGVETEDHHNLVGHLRDFQSYAPDAATLCTTYRGWSKSKLLAEQGFLKLCAQRPKAWRDLSQNEKDAMRALLDAKLPKR